MKLQTVPANRGSAWVKQGFRVFFKQPLAFAALFAAFMFAVFLLAMVPFVGSLVVLALLPLVSLGYMIATKRVLEGGFPTPQVYFEPLRGPRPQLVAMVQMGLAYAMATFVIMWLSDLVDGGAFEALMDALPDAQKAPDAVAAKLVDPRLALGMMLRFALAGLLSVPFWHAPALVHWDGHGCEKALFSSTLACWRNKGAFTVYSAVWMALIAGLGAAGSILFGLLGAPQVFAVVAVPLSLLITTVFYASLYFTFADSFVSSDTVVAHVG